MSDEHATRVSQPLEAEEKNGVYLLEIQAEYEGYTVLSAQDRLLVENVAINGNYVGPKDAFETECDDFELVDGTFNLLYRGVSDDE